MSEQNFGNAREKTILNDYRYKHPSTEAPLPGGKFPATMQWEIGNNGKIIFKVNDGVYNGSNDQSYKKKQQDVSLFDRNAIFNILREAATNPNFEKVQYPIKEKIFVREGGQPKQTSNPVVLATFTIIREASGVIKMGFTKSDYKALFVFDKVGDSDMLEFKNGEWTRADGLNSRMFVLGYISAVQPFLNNKEFDKYQPKAPKQNNGGGNNGGGYNNRGGNGGGNGGGYGGGNNNSFDDEIPDF